METWIVVGALAVSVVVVNVAVWFLLYRKERQPVDPRMKQILRLIRDFEKNRGTLLEIHEINPDDVFLRKRGGL